ncbi:DUF6986 family protein [Serinicoccus marinus]|uniref:DUF6986 family protein n=1 Tax=Serinicoccus marinus TaxID=247333 RepID=UPI002490D19C|nr:hypothetical protein [Serinicoccus marinus]
MSAGLEQLVAAVQAEADERLAQADADLARLYPGDPATRQPVHTVYVPADAFEQQTPWRWGAAALELMDDHLPDAAAVTRVTGMDAALADEVLPRVRRKLAEQPFEDLRVDVEDGYGRRPDDVEDAHLGSAVEALRTYAETDGAPRWYGIRIKCLERDYRHRGLRTLVDAVAGMASRQHAGHGTAARARRL